MWPQAARSSRGACEQSLSYWYDCGWLHEYMAHEYLKSSLAFRKPAVAGSASASAATLFAAPSTPSKSVVTAPPGQG